METNRPCVNKRCKGQMRRMPNLEGEKAAGVWLCSVCGAKFTKCSQPQPAKKRWVAVPLWELG